MGDRSRIARFAIEVAETVSKVWGPGRVGIRFSPAKVNDTADSNPQELFAYAVEKLGDMGLAFVHMIEGQTQGARDAADVDYGALRQAFKGAYIANNGYDRDLAIETLSRNRADMIAFGRAYLANPDLVERLRHNAPLNEPDRATFYGGDAKGYTDYPTLDRAA